MQVARPRISHRERPCIDSIKSFGLKLRVVILVISTAIVSRLRVIASLDMEKRANWRGASRFSRRTIDADAVNVEMKRAASLRHGRVKNVRAIKTIAPVLLPRRRVFR